MTWSCYSHTKHPPPPQVGKSLQPTNQCHVTLRAFSALDLEHGLHCVTPRTKYGTQTQYYEKYSNVYLPQSVRLIRTVNWKLQERQDRCVPIT